MVRANRAGIKTQTRRTRGLDKINEAPGEWKFLFVNADGNFVFQNNAPSNSCVFIKCPYWRAEGDRLWVRETWQGFRLVNTEHDEWEDMSKESRGDLTINDFVLQYGHHDIRVRYKADDNCNPDSWLPGIHMPRWASRDTLEVISVRPERLQDITEGDALAEGFGPRSAIALFRGTWSVINGIESWDRNPWVWVVSYRRLNA